MNSTSNKSLNFPGSRLKTSREVYVKRGSDTLQERSCDKEFNIRGNMKDLRLDTEELCLSEDRKNPRKVDSITDL